MSVAPESIVCTAEIGSGDHLLLPTCMKMESGLPVIFIAIFTEVSSIYQRYFMWYPANYCFVSLTSMPRHRAMSSPHSSCSDMFFFEKLRDSKKRRERQNKISDFL